MTEEGRSRTTSPTRYSKATHLTEFYPYLNGGSVTQPVFTSPESLTSNGNSHALYQQTGMHSRKQSLSSYTSFTPSTLDFRSLVTKTEISHTTESLEQLLQASEKYRRALALVADAAGDFGAALEKTAKCKGAGTAADGLLSAGGLFFLVANHQQLLAHSVKESFETPVRKEVTKFKEQSTQNEEEFKLDIRERVRELKQQEKENARLSKSKTRNLVAYRTKLVQLTSHIDEIDKLKHEYYQSAFDLVQDTSSRVLTQVGSIVRAQVEIYEGIAKKGWSGGGLDELIAQCPDPFTTAEEEEAEEAEEEELEQNKNASSPDTVTDRSFNSTLMKEPTFKTDEQGISFNRGVFATNPVLSHQQSIQTFRTTDPMTASTPIIMSPKSTNGNLVQDKTINADDNSFSLPVPGSSRSKKEDVESPAKKDVLPNSVNAGDNISEETNEAGDSDVYDDGDSKEQVQDETSNTEEPVGGLLPSPALEGFPIHNEWRDDSDGLNN